MVANALLHTSPPKTPLLPNPPALEPRDLPHRMIEAQCLIPEEYKKALYSFLNNIYKRDGMLSSKDRRKWVSQTTNITPWNHDLLHKYTTQSCPSKNNDNENKTGTGELRKNNFIESRLLKMSSKGNSIIDGITKRQLQKRSEIDRNASEEIRYVENAFRQTALTSDEPQILEDQKNDRIDDIKHEATVKKIENDKYFDKLKSERSQDIERKIISEESALQIKLMTPTPQPVKEKKFIKQIIHEVLEEKELSPQSRETSPEKHVNPVPPKKEEPIEPIKNTDPLHQPASAEAKEDWKSQVQARRDRKKIEREIEMEKEKQRQVLLAQQKREAQVIRENAQRHEAQLRELQAQKEYNEKMCQPPEYQESWLKTKVKGFINRPTKN